MSRSFHVASTGAVVLLTINKTRNMAKTKEIKIAGKKVKIAYCYATEIAFHDLTGKDFATFLRTSVEEQNASPKEIMCSILAGIMAYYQSAEKESPITDKDLMFNASNEEITEAFKEIVVLFTEWYRLPTDEEPKEKGSKGKN